MHSLAAIATDLAAHALPWELATGTTPVDRCYRQLVSTDEYDAWLIHWPAGAGLDAHDHGGSWGAFSIVDGSLDEDVEVDGALLTRTVSTGRTVSFDPSHVHAVVNRSSRGATSVHVYSPPLHSMQFFADDGTGARVVDRIEHAGSSWAPVG